MRQVVAAAALTSSSSRRSPIGGDEPFPRLLTLDEDGTQRTLWPLIASPDPDGLS
jgi:hypothetical protein